MNLATRVVLGAATPAAIVTSYTVWAPQAQNPFFPAADVIVDRFGQTWLGAGFAENVVPTLANLARGLGLAIVVGIALGLLLARVTWVRQLCMPLVHLGRSVPIIAIAPPLILILGIGDAPKVLTIALGCTFPILLATMDGVTQTDRELLDAGRAMLLPTRTRVLRIWLPSAAPSLFGGLQTALQFALSLALASEMVASLHGIGFVTLRAQKSFDSPTVWAGLLLVGLLGWLFNGLLVLVRRRAIGWHDAMRVRNS